MRNESENYRPTIRSNTVERHHHFEAVNQFTTSISLRIRNSRREGTINSVDDIELPSFPGLRPALVSSHSCPSWSASEGNSTQHRDTRSRTWCGSQAFGSDSPNSGYRPYTAPPPPEALSTRPLIRRRNALNVTAVPGE